MMNISAICTDEQRRAKVRSTPDLNGLDYLEVDSDDQLTLKVYFLRKAPAAIGENNVIIEGGRRITNIKVLDADVKRDPNPEIDDYMIVTVDKAGDFSTYTLRVVEVDHYQKGLPVYRDMKDFDARYARLDFSFKAGCASDLDCKIDDVCPPAPLVEPEINYLAKDYASFRQVILDRLALTIPGWQERHVPDIGITLVEILAYVGDYLSYYQDAVATEAYLETARQRISVRRHARLVDYTLHEGCNARSWLFVHTSVDQTASSSPPLYPSDLYFITGSSDDVAASSTMLTADIIRNIPADSYEAFEVLQQDEKQALAFYKHHNEIHFYTWGDKDCCLPKGATSATLEDFEPAANENEPENSAETAEDNNYGQRSEQQGYAQKQSSYGNAPKPSKPAPAQRPRILHLKKGDYLLFEEVMGAKTGVPDDADSTHRHVVRLTNFKEATDALYNKNVLEIEWSVEDALPFPLCISAIGRAPTCQQLENISVARGNILLIDHGLTQPDEQLDPVQEGDSTAQCEGPGHPSDVTVSALPYRTQLKHSPLTYSEQLPTSIVPAARLLTQDIRNALPEITLSSTIAGANPAQPWTWLPQADLLESNGEDRHFVVEINNDGYAQLRFGDDELGRAPQVGEKLTAHYRIGNGPMGNVGAETITRVVLRNNITLSGIVFTPRNPLPAQGGTAQEPLSEAKLFAPRAFRTKLERAITADDYAQLAQDVSRVQRAAASLRWNGSGYTVLVAIDPLGTEEADQTLLDTAAQHLEPYRRIGHDVIVRQAKYVPLEIVMNVCVRPHYLRGHVKAALLKLFSNRLQPDGTPGFFHPDNLSFGDNIAVSTLVARAQAVPGVLNVTVTKLQRFGEAPDQELRNGVLLIGPSEVAQVDNDPSFPEHGTITFTMTGGR